MRAVQIVNLDGPEHALALTEIASPALEDSYAGPEGVLIDVESAGVSFTDVLHSRGQYQLKLPVPFVPGCEVSGTVRSASSAATVAPGDRVIAFCGYGGFAEVAVAPAVLTFKLPAGMNSSRGAGLILNYHTAVFALSNRGTLQAGETVLIHGAAGGVGTAAIQVAAGLGATTIALVSSEGKAKIADLAGADRVVRSDEPWLGAVREITGGAGVDLVLDPVGGDRFLDSLRATAETGRIVVVGFAAGDIPNLAVNRLLLSNTSVIGAAWGPFVTAHPEANAEIAAVVAQLAADGYVRPVVGALLPLERATDALLLLDRRQAVGKVVLEVANG